MLPTTNAANDTAPASASRRITPPPRATTAAIGVSRMIDGITSVATRIASAPATRLHVRPPATNQVRPTRYSSVDSAYCCTSTKSATPSRVRSSSALAPDTPNAPSTTDHPTSRPEREAWNHTKQPSSAKNEAASTAVWSTKFHIGCCTGQARSGTRFARRS
jgi:hypothetical protein